MTLLDKLTPQGRREIIVLIVRFVIITVAVILRFIGKFTRDQKNKIWWDDFWIVVAWCFNAATEALTVWGLVASGGGMALPKLIKGGNLQGAKDFLLAEDLGSMIWHGAVACVCLSILCFYLRIFKFEDNVQNYVYGLFILCSLWGIGSMVSGILLCSPPSNFWNMKNVEKCANYNTYLLITSILEIVLTSTILALPIKPVLKLNLDLRTRLTVLGIFLLGGFVIITEIIRIAVIYRPGVRTPNLYELMIWSAVHITAAFVSACLPVCKPVWVRVFNFSKSIIGYSRRITRRLRSRGTHSGPDQAPGSSSSGSKKTGSSSNLRRIEQLPGNKHDGDSMIEEYGRWGNGDWNSEGISKV